MEHVPLDASIYKKIVGPQSVCLSSFITKGNNFALNVKQDPG